MMTPFAQIFAKVRQLVYQPGAGTRLFRGHSSPDWRLLPSMARVAWLNDDDLRKTEFNAFGGFVTSAGSLLPPNVDPWTVAFAMQHHGLPTRLLDWTQNFAIALYFALRGADGDAVVWMLDPYELNLASRANSDYIQPYHLPADYRAMFIDRTAEPPRDVIALMPPRNHPRLFNQQSGFTLHSDLTTPLDELYPDVVTPIAIPKVAQTEAREFLDIVGITEFTLFPDLDGLARHMTRMFARRSTAV